MPDAVIVVANERQFSEQAKALKDYLRKKCRMHVVIDVPAWDRTPEELESPLLFRICAARARPLLIAYIGHGSGPEDERKGYGWGYAIDAGKYMFFPYEKLAELLQHREGPTMILNDCCYAGALSDMLEAKRPSDKPLGVISATGIEGYAYGDLIPTVIESWERREEYVPKIRVRYDSRKHTVHEARAGDKLDHLFFPREP